jgi:hypothetical protein
MGIRHKLGGVLRFRDLPDSATKYRWSVMNKKELDIPSSDLNSSTASFVPQRLSSGFCTAKSSDARF